MRGTDTNPESNINTTHLLGGHTVSKHAFEVVRDLQKEIASLQEQLSNMMAVVASCEKERDDANTSADEYADKYVVAQAQLTACEKDRDQQIKECNEFWGKKSDADYTLINKLQAQLAVTEALLATYRAALESIKNGSERDSTIFEIATDALALQPPQAALNNAIADVLEDVAEGFMSDDPVTGGNMIYYGSHIRGVLRNRAKELREEVK